MKTIYTNKNEAILVDDEDYNLLIKHAWYVANTGYANNGRLGNMHTFIKPAPSGMVVDHINQNKLDNQKFNLRHVSYSVNLINSKARSSTSGQRGVYLMRSGKYRAMVTRNKQSIHLGMYNTEQDAVTRITEYRQNESMRSQ